MTNESGTTAGHAARGAVELSLDAETIELLRSRLPTVAQETVRAVTVEVPAYTDAFSGPMGATIESAVRLALAGFLKLAGSSDRGGPTAPLAPALEGAYELGRGEARSGRSMDALLSAYRVGARVAWRYMSEAAVAGGLAASTLAKFAELVFAYIDELSASSAAGHADELATSGRVRERYLHRLALSLLHGDAPDLLAKRADRANWEPPDTLAAVVLPSAHVAAVLRVLDPRTLRAEEGIPDLDEDHDSDVAVLLVPDAVDRSRPATLAKLRTHHACIGPAKPWADARVSYLRALRARRLQLEQASEEPVDTEKHLARLVLAADASALTDLRAQALAPLADLRPSTVDRLVETLRAWLLHQGRRDEVARSLHVHPQTVRYRMTQLRDVYGERLEEPDTVLALTVALGDLQVPHADTANTSSQQGSAGNSP
ncbi:MAG TPA: helix-turn-helix domain-containing protein [Nocardioidaceae bacterium]|nr:helix-turn-helix domain-containing protein [Nocardioidaceae bacterium]